MNEDILDDLQHLTYSQNALLHRLVDLGLLEVDYHALHDLIKDVFVEKFGQDVVIDVSVAHFNPDLIDASVVVTERQPAMDTTALQLTDALRREGLRVGVYVVQSARQ
ncbi:MAG: hypothetical protein ACKO9F_19850, partial [Caldilinea sp.]